jgi:hypothetical protein
MTSAAEVVFEWQSQAMYRPTPARNKVRVSGIPPNGGSRSVSLAEGDWAYKVDDLGYEYISVPSTEITRLYINQPLTLDLRLPGADHPDGYWTWDSAEGIYTINTSKTVIVTSGGQQVVDKFIKTSGGTANIVLKDAAIDLSSSAYPPDINYKSPFEVIGTVNLTLRGTNTLKGSYTGAGLQVEGNNTVNIGGNGILTAEGPTCAGIGGGSGNYPVRETDGGNITISGGTIYAIGNHEGAGIGGGTYSNGNSSQGGNGGNITITGGTVYAVANGYGAAIGGGSDCYAGSGGNITITGGTVYATSERGAGIGSASWVASGDHSAASGGNITISGGMVTAASNREGAGIGSGSYGDGGNITISGGTVTAAGGSYGGAGIGGGNYGTSGVITIYGNATVTAEGGGYAAGIGGGHCYFFDSTHIGGDVDSITILAPAAGRATMGPDGYKDIGPGNSYDDGPGAPGIVSVWSGFSGSHD